MKKNFHADLIVSRGHFGLFNPADNSFTPESCRSLLLRSSSLSLKDLEMKTEHRASQLLLVMLQEDSLKINYICDQIESVIFNLP